MKYIILTLIFILFAPYAVAAKYIKLPDGSLFPVKEGESYEHALREAQRIYPKPFGLIKLPREKIMDMNWFNQCKSKNIINAKTEAAIVQLTLTCEYQSVPKKCRQFQIERDGMGNESSDARLECVKSCNEANFYSSKVGECSKG